MLAVLTALVRFSFEAIGYFDLVLKMFFSHTRTHTINLFNFFIMVLTKLVKVLLHSYAKNGDLQFSYWSCGDYTNYVEAKRKGQEWCNKQNEEAGYEKFTCEIVNLYGEATKW